MLRLLRAAVSRGYRPTTLLRRVQPHSKWDDLDFDLVNALDRLERDVNPTTGLMWWQTRTGYPGIGFEVEVVDDDAEAALERYDEQQRDKKKARAGSHRFAVARALVDGEEIEGGLARERMIEYARQQAEGTPDESTADLIALGVDVTARGGSYDAAEYG